MPRYFFDIADTGGTIEDEEGFELPDDASARDEGIQSMRELAAEAVKLGQPMGNRILKIYDARRHLLLELPFSAVSQ